jgi:hypothetical protein
MLNRTLRDLLFPESHTSELREDGDQSVYMSLYLTEAPRRQQANPRLSSSIRVWRHEFSFGFRESRLLECTAQCLGEHLRQ